MSKQEEYTRQDPITHILKRPDMYVGSKSFEPQLSYVWENDKIVKKIIAESRALKRTFIEILSNALDNLERDKKMTYIKVTLTSTSCKIVNDGSVIPIVMNEKEKMYNHSLIFGHLLSGSNYNDNQQRFTSGRNGLGAKLTNVLSTEFTVEGLDPVNKLKLTQTWKNNMKETSGPVVSKTVRKTGYTSIEWKWDCDWFQKGLKELNKDTIDMLTMLVVNASMVSGIGVYLNEVKLPNKLSEYFTFFKDIEPEAVKCVLKLESGDSKVFVTQSSNREFEAISFVNGIQTKNGGKHVNAWVEAVCRPLIEKLKSVTLKDVKPFFRFLVVSRIPNPEFDGQEKNELVNPTVKAEQITSSQVSKITKWPIWKDMTQLIQVKDNKKLEKNVASKSINVEGYSKANNSGGKHSKNCSLIICEGLSAKTFAIEGISYGVADVKGRDWFGIYPLRGKLLNTRNATKQTISANQIITNLIKILGLSCSNPDDLSKMNYGRIYILTDADVDGIHIEGLLINFFHSMFPKLLHESMVFSMKTPILKVSVANRVMYYFDEQTFRRSNLQKNAKVKYLKGLGTNNSEDIKHVFGKKILKFLFDENVDSVIKSAFDKNDAGNRKNWLETYSPFRNSHKTLDDETENFIPFEISRLLNDELIKFFHDDCKRSIPSIFDGLKESQRKIVYAIKKRKLSSEIKVAQLGAYVAENTNYHHGEENLFKTIIKMAQDFPGSNNLPLLVNDGQFGSRLAGGEDASKPRYIFTKPHLYFNLMFPTQDDHLLEYRIDDGDKIEPYHYVPIIPMLLVNGCVGIGTGWMCNSPQFNPQDVMEMSTLWMKNEHEKLDKFISNTTPWYRGFKGVIEKGEKTSKFQTSGVFTRKNKTIKISELPVYTWTNKFEEDLKEWEQSGSISKLKTYSSKTDVHIEFETTQSFDEKNFVKKMTSTLNLDNIVVFDKDEKILRVDIKDIINMWGSERLSLNEKRKMFQISDLEEQIKLLSQKIDFINLVRNKTVILTDDETTIVNILKVNIAGITNSDIEVLRNLPNKFLTENERMRLLNKKSNLEKDLEIILKKTPRDLWFEDVSKLEI
jgi:DNA topoisomerase-2